MKAQAVTGTPGHINSMARAVRHFLAKFPAHTMKEGDIFLTNDPWKGTGHLHDFTFVTPTFRRGKMVAIFASTCHVVDIGAYQTRWPGKLLRNKCFHTQRSAELEAGVLRCGQVGDLAPLRGDVVDGRHA